jgi:hypothetical protein
VAGLGIGHSFGIARDYFAVMQHHGYDACDGVIVHESLGARWYVFEDFFVDAGLSEAKGGCECEGNY